MHPVLQTVCRSLKRSSPPRIVPAPPAIAEPIVRLVHSDIGLAELFAERAKSMKMIVQLLSVDELLPEIASFLGASNWKRVMLSDTPLLTRLGAAKYLQDAGFDARTWAEISLDETYDFDAGLTDVDYAVAETGTLVIRHRKEHGRLLSLTPFAHVAVVEPKHLLPDLLDLFQKLATEGCGGGVTMISGPSKTADIEMNVVTGVHGPNVVKAFVLQ